MTLDVARRTRTLRRYRFMFKAAVAEVAVSLLVLAAGVLAALNGAGTGFIGLSLIMFIIAFLGARWVLFMHETGQVSPDLEWPRWVIYLCIPFGSGLMCYRFLQVFYRFARRGELPVHGAPAVEPMQQIAEPPRCGGHVECQRPTRLRKAQRRRVGSAEPLEHGKEAGGAAGRQSFDDRAHRILLPERHDELVLHHPPSPVQAVPRSDQIEWVEERADPLNLADSLRNN